MPVVRGISMTATKAELKAAFEAGQRTPPGDFAFEVYFEGVRKANAAARAKARRDNLKRGKALIEEVRRRSYVKLGEADRPAPPYTKE
jgi:hypothetical protein